jgi:hypothetical protein
VVAATWLPMSAVAALVTIIVVAITVVVPVVTVLVVTPVVVPAVLATSVMTPPVRRLLASRAPLGAAEARRRAR